MELAHQAKNGRGDPFSGLISPPFPPGCKEKTKSHLLAMERRRRRLHILYSIGSISLVWCLLPSNFHHTILFGTKIALLVAVSHAVKLEQTDFHMSHPLLLLWSEIREGEGGGKDPFSYQGLLSVGWTLLFCTLTSVWECNIVSTPFSVIVYSIDSHSPSSVCPPECAGVKYCYFVRPLDSSFCVYNVT